MSLIEDLMTVKDAGEALGVSPRRIRALLRSRRVGVKVGNQWLLHREELPGLIPQDKYLPGGKEMFYPVLSTNLNEPLALRFITLLREPARTNLSGEARVEGWLGTTDNWHREALGRHDEEGARAVLHEHDVRIPDNIPVRPNHRYAIGGSEQAEEYNDRLAYPYQGPWYNVPDREVQWCLDPARVFESRTLPDSDADQELYTVVVTDSPPPEFAWGGRCWYELDRYHGSLAEAQEWAGSLIGTMFDRSRMPTLNIR